MAIITLNNNALVNADVGKVLQVVSYSLDDSSGISTTSSSYVSTSVTVTLPSLATTGSKVMLWLTVGETYNAPIVALYRDGSLVSNSTAGNAVGGGTGTLSTSYLDAPNKTTSTTYTVYFKGVGSEVFLKNNSAQSVNFTAMEIGA